MSLFASVVARFGKRRRAAHRAQAPVQRRGYRPRPAVEELEPRVVPATRLLAAPDLHGPAVVRYHAVGHAVPASVLRVPGLPGQVAPARFTWLAAAAAFRNELGLFFVDDAAGHIGRLRPGDPGYAAAALSLARSRVLFRSGQTAGAVRTLDLPAGHFFGLYLVQNATTAAFRAHNPSDLPGGGPLAFFSFAAANPDRLGHARFLGAGRFAWEDLLGGGSGNFDALTARVRFGRPRGGPPPVALPPHPPAQSQAPAGAVEPLDLAALLPPAVRVNVGSRASLPGALQELSWETAGGATGLETLIELRPPGDVYPVGGSLDVRPGSLPATGDVSYLKPDGSLTSEPTAYATGQASGHTAFNLPAGAKEGEWQAVVLLRDPGTGQVVSADAANFLVSSKPAVFLHVNRTLANTTDPIHAELLTSAGTAPQNVQVLATLLRPDGTEVSLPNRVPSLRFLYEGPSTSATFDLFHGTLGETGVGDYLLRVRMLSATTGDVLALADAAIHVSDTRGSLSGVVRADGAAVDGTKAKFAFVQAFDVDDGSVTAGSGLGADGSYHLTLDPGRYLISANVLDVQGDHRTADSTQLTVVGPEGTNLTLDMTLGAPVGPAIDPPGDPAPPPAGNNLPRPKVSVDLVGVGLSSPDTVTLLQEILANDVSRGAGPGLSVNTKADLEALVQRDTERQRAGADAGLDLQDLQGALGFDFAIVGILRQQNGQQRLAVSVLKLATGDVLNRFELSQPGTDEGALLTLVDNAGQRVAAGLLDLLRAARPRPADPRFQVRLVSGDDAGNAGAAAGVRVHPNDPVTFTVKLTDADGSVQANKPIKLEVRDPQGFSGVTGTNGVFTGTFTNPDPGDDGVQAVYSRGGETFTSAEVPFVVQDQSRLQLSAPAVMLRGGQPVSVAFDLFDANLGGVPNAPITLEATNGTLLTDHVVTNGLGQGEFLFTAGTRNGPARVTATYRRPAGPDGPEQVVTGNIDFVVTGLVDVNLNTAAPPNAAGTPAVDDGGSADVFADLYVGAFNGSDEPIYFTLQGGGALDGADGQTDENGRAHVIYVPPADGTGTATVTATTTVDGTSYSKSVTIAYQPAPQTVSGILVTSRGTPSAPFPGLLVGDTFKFRAELLPSGILDQDGSQVTWTATGGTIGSDGTFTAGRVSGIYQVTATSKTNPMISGQDSFSVGLIGAWSNRATITTTRGDDPPKTHEDNGYFVEFVPDNGGIRAALKHTRTDFPAQTQDVFFGPDGGNSFVGQSIAWQGENGVSHRPSGASLSVTLNRPYPRLLGTYSIQGTDLTIPSHPVPVRFTIEFHD